MTAESPPTLHRPDEVRPPDELRRLEDVIGGYERLLIGFSGGADSALLAAVAARVLGERAVAVTAVSASLPGRERDAARVFCRRHRISHLEIATDEMSRPQYVANAPDRCYHCKSALFDALAPLRRISGAAVALGTNLDDLGEHRPGHAAATEVGAVAPLVDAGLDKAAVRALSRHLGLETADKPAAACLSSRISYGDPVTADTLRRIEAAEDAVRDLGFPTCRVRAHADGTVARLEVPAADIERAAARATELDVAIRGTGFSFAGLDLGGFASGRMNVLIPTIGRRPPPVP